MNKVDDKTILKLRNSIVNGIESSSMQEIKTNIGELKQLVTLKFEENAKCHKSIKDDVNNYKKKIEDLEKWRDGVLGGLGLAKWLVGLLGLGNLVIILVALINYYSR
jgi:hypothetical protein